MQLSHSKNWKNLSAASSLFYNVNVPDLLCVFVCVGHSCLLYAAFFLMHVNDLPALNRSTIIFVLSLTDLLDGSNYLAPEVHGKQGLLLSLWTPKKEKLLMLTLLAPNVLEMLACIWLLFLGLLFFFAWMTTSVYFWSQQVAYFLLLCTPVLHFVLAKAVLSGMPKYILQHRRNITFWLSHIPLNKVKTYYSWGSQGLCLSRDVMVPKVCLWFFLPNTLGKIWVWTKKLKKKRSWLLNAEGKSGWFNFVVWFSPPRWDIRYCSTVYHILTYPFWPNPMILLRCSFKSTGISSSVIILTIPREAWTKS